jgi:hypothetical protein
MDKTNSSWLKTLSIGFSVISFGITIAIVGYIVLTAKQNQPTNQPSPTSTIDETANWKTYIDNQNRFSFKYPANFRTYQSTGFVQVDLNQSGGMPTRWLRVSVGDSKDFKFYPTGLSILEVGKSYKPYGDASETWTRLTNIKIDNHQAKLFEGKNISELPIKRIIVLSKNDFIYQISYVPYIATKDYQEKHPEDPEASIDFVDIFDQILSTFRFTTP